MQILARQAELVDELSALTAELEAIYNGAAASQAKRVKGLVEAFCEAWAVKYRAKYAFQGAKDATAAKRLVRAFTDEDLRARVTVYLATDDPFYYLRKHPFSLFASQINSFVPEVKADDYGHAPPCRTHSECLARYLREQKEASA